MKKRLTAGRQAAGERQARLPSGNKRQQSETEITMLAKAILASPIDAIIGRTLDGTITSWNIGAERLLGYTAAEVIGQPLTLTLQPDAHFRIEQNTLRIIAGESVAPHETRLITRDGRVIDVLNTVTPIRNAAGKITRAAIILHDITALKRAEAALTEREAWFGAAFDQAAVGMAMREIAPGKLCWMRVNRKLCDILGYTREELMQLTFFDITPSEDRQIATGYHERILRGEISNYTREKRFLRKDGHIIWANLSLSTVCGPDGRPTHIVAVIEDISDRKRAEQSRANLAAIVDSAGDAIIGRALDGTITSWNTAAEQMFGYSESEAIGQPISLIWPRALGNFEKNNEILLRGLAIPAIERVRVTKDGRKIEVSLGLSPIRDAAGNVTGAALIYRDITALKQAERELEDQQAQLAAIVENAHEAIIGRTLEGTITSWNAAAERIYGYSAGEAIGKSIGMLALDPIRQTAENNAALRRGIAIPARERQRITKDGQIISVMASVSPVRNEAGEVVSAAIITHDLSDLKKAQRDLEQLNRELEQRVTQRTADLAAANSELEAFSYSVSHDLRAPLRAIGGFARLALEQLGVAVPPETLNFLDRISRNVEKMNALIDELLAYSRLQRNELRRQPVVTANIVWECLETLRAGEQNRNIELMVGELPDCEADPVLLGQVWMNLLANAFKFTAQSKPAHIEIGSLNTSEGTVYFVRDNGAGFDMQYASKLFNVFQRLHRTSEFAGHGIGLATVHNILLRHRGRIWAEAAPGKGATFFFTLGDAG